MGPRPRNAASAARPPVGWWKRARRGHMSLSLTSGPPRTTDATAPPHVYSHHCSTERKKAAAHATATPGPDAAPPYSTGTRTPPALRCAHHHHPSTVPETESARTHAIHNTAACGTGRRRFPCVGARARHARNATGTIQPKPLSLSRSPGWGPGGALFAEFFHAMSCGSHEHRSIRRCRSGGGREGSGRRGRDRARQDKVG